jgi:drug/metabolite transporter (DMT)-like permease
MSSTNAGASSPGAAEFALLAGVSLAWGTSYMFTKIAVGAIPPVTLIALRTIIGAAVMAAILVLSGGVPRLTRRDVASLALVGLMANAAPLCLIAISVSMVDSSVTATTMSLVPLITALFAASRGELPTKRAVLGIAIGFAGILVLFGPDAFASFGDSARGAVAAIAAATVFSASLFVMARVRHLPPLMVATGALFFAALWTLPVALVIDGPPPSLPGGSVIGAVLVLAIVNTAASNLLVFALIARTGPAFTSYNNYLVPAVAVACGSLFLGEPFTVQSAAGVALVLAGVAVSTFSRGAPPSPPSPPTVA